MCCRFEFDRGCVCADNLRGQPEVTDNNCEEHLAGFVLPALMPRLIHRRGNIGCKCKLLEAPEGILLERPSLA